MYGIAIALILLLVVGIRNGWDLVTWISRQEQKTHNYGAQRFHDMVINLMSAVLAVVGIYYVWAVFQGGNFLWLVVPAALLVVAFGLAARRKWGAVAWYIFAAFASCWWVFTSIKLAASDWPYTDTLQAAIFLLPGLALLLFCVLGTIQVRRSLGRRPNAP